MIFIVFFNFILFFLLRLLIALFCIYVLDIKPNAEVVLVISGLVSCYISFGIILALDGAKKMNELGKSQKRTCNNCKALVADRCWLAHQIKEGDVGYIPLEPCEKPTSMRMLARLLHYKLIGLI